MKGNGDELNTPGEALRGMRWSFFEGGEASVGTQRSSRGSDEGRKASRDID